MSKRSSAVRLRIAVVTAAVALAGCASSGAPDGDAARAGAGSDVVAVGDAPLPADAPAPGDGVGSLRDAMEVAAAAPGQASDAACTLDRQTLESAIETYELLNGEPPASQQELLGTQIIREASVRFEIGPDGAVVPTPGSPCT